MNCTGSKVEAMTRLCIYVLYDSEEHKLMSRLLKFTNFFLEND